MTYLILAMICSASLAVVLRLSETYSSNKYGILTGNYVTCMIMGFLALPEKNLLPSGGLTALWAGGFNGVVFLGSLLLLQLNIKKNGAVLASTFSKLGILLPVVASILFLGERPTFLQAAGILLVVAAIVVLNLEKGENQASFKAGLLLLTICSGTADGMAKVFEAIGERAYDGLFLFYTFLIAFLLSLIPLIHSRKKIKPVDIISGILVGIPNYLSTWFLLAALSRLPAYLAYPSYSVGTILIVSFVSVFLLKDKMTRKQLCGCGLILAALAMLNLSP